MFDPLSVFNIDEIFCLFFLSLSICFLLLFIVVVVVVVVVVVNWNCWQLYISLFYQRAILRALKMLIICRVVFLSLIFLTPQTVW